MEYNDAIKKFSAIISNSHNSSLEEVTALLDYYNKPSTIIDINDYHPLNDPKTAEKLNNQYHRLTGKNHPRFISEVPKVINKLMNQKDILIDKKIFDEQYFSELNSINNYIEQAKKNNFVEARNNQRTDDLITRENQIEDQQLSNSKADKFNGRKIK